MSKIRKLYYFDKKSTQEMISFLNNSANDTYISKIMYNPFLLLHHFLPLRFKFLPESFVLKDNKEVKGLITVAPTRSKNRRVEIQKLLFEENSYHYAAELVQYAVVRYKAAGASSVIVKVDDYLPELLSMFVNKCGFSQISYEKLWRVTEFVENNFNKREYRSFRNSDDQALVNLYNDMLLPHFRTLLSKGIHEFKENIFQGLTYFSEYKYVIEDKKTGAMAGCILIKTYDNENYIVDIIQASWIDIDVNSALSYAIYQIKKRKKKFGLFVRTKRYTSFGEKYEKIFAENGFKCIQNQIVLTNSSAKILKEPIKTGRFTVLNDFCPTKVMPT